MSKMNLMGNNLSDLSSLVESFGERPFKGKQLFKWLYNNQQYDFSRMTDLSKSLRTALENKCTVELLKPEQTQQSVDGTEKFLFRLAGNHPIETVVIPDFNGSGRKTVCISSQAGCALACRFCATGTMGLLKDLTPGEILGQLLYLRERGGREAFSNVVIMGMGEPLNNYDNIIEALKIATDPNGLSLSPKRITLSTSGVTPKIRKLADSGLNVQLALSLHAALQSKREQIMPVAKTFRLTKLMDAIRYYAEKTSTRVTIEYILFKGFNDTTDDVRLLEKLLRGIPCKLNILAYNPVAGLDFDRPTEQEVDWFGRQLFTRLPAVTVRKSRGLDINAACGQLAVNKTLEVSKNA